MELRIPSQREIKHCFGPSLAEAFFELSNSAVRTLVGVTPQLKGPTEQLWHSPSDQLIEKNCLKLPVNRSIVQAATHRGILELGERALRQYTADVREKMRKDLCSEIKNVHLLIEAEQRYLADNRIKKIEDQCTGRINILTREYDEKLEKALDDVITRYNGILQKAVVQTRTNVTLEMMKKMRKEVMFIVTDLNADYDRRCTIQRDNMIATFNIIIRKEREKMKDVLRTYETEKTEYLETIRAKMENEFRDKSKKFVNCEKYRCEKEKREIREDLEKTIVSLQELLEQANKEATIVEEKPPVVIAPDYSIWRARIKHIVQEFRKFIKFALATAPDQANFLLPRDSLLQFPDEHEDPNESSN